MAPLLRDRHKRERAKRVKIRVDLERDLRNALPGDAGGDSRYRIPLIGVNPGAVPGSRPDHVVR